MKKDGHKKTFLHMQPHSDFVANLKMQRYNPYTSENRRHEIVATAAIL